jgi:hypothetical protein
VTACRAFRPAQRERTSRASAEHGQPRTSTDTATVPPRQLRVAKLSTSTRSPTVTATSRSRGTSATPETIFRSRHPKVIRVALVPQRLLPSDLKHGNSSH